MTVVREENMRAHPRLFDRFTFAIVCAFAFLYASFAPHAMAQIRSFELMEATIPQLQAALSAGTVTSKDLVTAYLARIEAYDQRGPALNAISVVNRKALDEAAAMD